MGFDRQAQPWWSKGEQEFRAHLHPDEHDRILYKQVRDFHVRMISNERNSIQRLDPAVPLDSVLYFVLKP